MALESERTSAVGAALLDQARALGARVSRHTAEFAQAASRPVAAASARLAQMPGARWIGGRLVRRILVANLVGLVIVIGGILYFSQYQTWLINSKRELLRVQGEIIAAAIAGDGKVDTDQLKIGGVSDPDEDEDRTEFAREFRTLELSIRPERVTPILRRLIQPITTRARIYGIDGTLVVDSATLLTRGQLSRHDPVVPQGVRPSTKNFWTRLKSWMIDEELPVYKEIGNANGRAYREVRAALEGTTTAMLLLNEKGEQIVSTAVPIQRAGVMKGALLLSSRPGDIDKILDDERQLILTLALISLLATLATSLLLARTVAGPMRRLSEAADHVSRNLATRHDLPDYSERADEVGQMAKAFSAMTTSLYRRIEASESFAADVAHELKNPLTAARSVAESLAYAKNDAQRAELVEQIKGELSRLNRLITDVSNASRLDAELARQQMRPVDATGVATTVAMIFKDILANDTRRVVTSVEPAPFDKAYTVNGDAGRLGQVLTNLVDNAISFSPEGRTVTVSVGRKGNTIELLVDDEGPGIPDDRLGIIFDRFYTDRPATEAQRGKNSGLGLSISREIIRAHGGEIRAENRRPAGQTTGSAGARFSVTLPALVVPRGGLASGRRAS